MQRATTALGNPFLSPEFSLAAGRSRPTARVAVLMDGQSIAGFFPFEKGRIGNGAPICGWVTPCQGLIHAPGVEWDCRELLRGCRLAVWQFTNLVAGQQPFVPYQDTAVLSPVIELAGGFASYKARLRARSAKFCRELERKERKLAHDVGGLRFVADSRDPSVLRTLIAWKSEQYRRTGLVDRFGFPWVIDLVENLLATRGRHVSGVQCALYAEGQLVAAQFGLRSGRHFAGWITGYSPRFAKYTPGLLQTIRLVEALAGAGVDIVEMGIGTAAYKDVLKSRDGFVGEGIVTGTSVLAPALRARRAATRRTARLLDDHPGLYRATRPLRSAYRKVTDTGSFRPDPDAGASRQRELAGHRSLSQVNGRLALVRMLYAVRAADRPDVSASARRLQARSARPACS